MARAATSLLEAKDKSIVPLVVIALKAKDANTRIVLPVPRDKAAEEEEEADSAEVIAPHALKVNKENAHLVVNTTLTNPVNLANLVTKEKKDKELLGNTITSKEVKEEDAEVAEAVVEAEEAMVVNANSMESLVTKPTPVNNTKDTAANADHTECSTTSSTKKRVSFKPRTAPTNAVLPPVASILTRREAPELATGELPLMTKPPRLLPRPSLSRIPLRMMPSQLKLLFRTLKPLPPPLSLEILLLMMRKISRVSRNTAKRKKRNIMKLIFLLLVKLRRKTGATIVPSLKT
jgi:hypothetical protein